MPSRVDTLRALPAPPFTSLEYAGLGVAQIVGASAAFVLPLIAIHPTFIDSADMTSQFVLLPFLISVPAMFLTTHMIGDYMGGQGKYALTVMGAGVGFVLFGDGWRDHPKRWQRYVHFTAPFVLGGVTAYWLTTWLVPGKSLSKISPIVTPFGYGLEVKF
jgi:hypothetical protein